MVVVLLLAGLVLTLCSVGLLFLDIEAFACWIREDWVIEYLTFAALLAGAGASLVRALRYRQEAAVRRRNV